MYSLKREPSVLAESKPLYSSDQLGSIDLDRVPHHIAIIMDGNRRWAKKHGLPQMMGHWKGADTLTHLVRAASQLGVKVLTVFAFSTENWKRSDEEVNGVMHLLKVYLERQRESMVSEGVRLDAIGNLKGLSHDLQAALDETKQATAECQKIQLVLAINYGGRDDIRRAIVSIVKDREEGRLSEAEITESTISRYLDTAPWKDPDLVIRTSGEMRLSNFLIWQSSYSEFYHPDVLWPDFSELELLKAIQELQARSRRFGGS